MPPQLKKLLIEIGPLIAFFITNWKAGIYWATGIFMVATALALALSWLTARRIPLMLLIGAGFVAVFGGLTLYFQDSTFIKIKVTLIMRGHTHYCPSTNITQNIITYKNFNFLTSERVGNGEAGADT